MKLIGLMNPIHPAVHHAEHQKGQQAYNEEC